MTTVVHIMLPGQQCERHFPLYPATSLAHVHALQSMSLPTVVPALVELAFRAPSAVTEGTSPLAAPGGSSALVFPPPNGSLLVGCWPLACTAWGSALFPATYLPLALCAGGSVTRGMGVQRHCSHPGQQANLTTHPDLHVLSSLGH